MKRGIRIMPRISVVIPVFNSKKYLKETIESVLAQTFQDWELLVINEFGSDDGSAEIIAEYSQKDSRIYLIQNTEPLGLAESLNKGIRLAKGEYIARLDADDLAHPKRFQKQIQFMDEHPKVIVCGTYQHHFGSEINWIHKPSKEPEQCRANLLFFCDLCHSTLMLRKHALLDYHLFYDKTYLAEDYELWTRIVQVGQISNIPEVLGKYRWGEGNITVEKKEQLNVESGKIVLKSLKHNLGLELDPSEAILFQGWENPFSKENAGKRREQLLDHLEYVLRRIYERNEVVGFYEPNALLSTIAAKWYWAKWGEPFNRLRKVKSIHEIFDQSYRVTFLSRVIRFYKNNKGIKVKIRKIVKKTKSFLHKVIHKLYGYTFWGYVDRKLDEQTRELERHINDMTWDRAVHVESKMNRIYDPVNEIYKYITTEFCENRKIYYLKGEKIRLTYLFQIPSCWPSFQSVWECLKNDDRFDVKILLFDREQKEKAQMNGARQFLLDREIPFWEAEKFDFVAFKPHIMIYQTPWDHAHRPPYLRSDKINAMGIRIAYIPYGIEYSNSVWKDYRFSNNKFIIKPWRVYCLSPHMKFDHYLQSNQGANHIVATGLPKFDIIYRGVDGLFDDGLKQRIANRKIIFWQMHFPAKDGTPDFPEPYIWEYSKFAEKICKYNEKFYFLVRLHPKFIEQYVKRGYQNDIDRFIYTLNNAENVYMYDESDYMPALLSADGIIGDRSALMIEAAALHKPVLYMTNFWYKEIMLESVSPIFESYYQGSQVYDIERFLDLVMDKEIDYKKEIRESAFMECIPYFDGNCGNRIVEDLVSGLEKEMMEEIQHA